MKYLFLSAGLLAFAASAPTQAQTQEVIDADEGDIICVDCGCETSREGYMQCAESFTGGDYVIAIGTLTGTYGTEDFSPVTAIGPQTLEDRNFSGVAEQLRAVPGVAISRSGNPGNLTQLRLRGAEANHTKILLDGIDISDPATGEYDFGGLSMDGVSKIEVYRGEASSLYGSDAIGGVVNISTRGTRKTRDFRTRLEAGSEDTLRGSFGAQIDNNRGDGFQIWGDASSSAGFDISEGGDEADGHSRRSLSMRAEASVNYIQLTGQLTFTDQTNAFDSDNDFDGRLDDTADALQTQRSLGYIRAEFETGDFEHSLTVSGSRSDVGNPFAAFQNDTTGKRLQGQYLLTRDVKYGNLSILADVKRESFTVFGGVGAGQNQSQTLDSQALAAEYFHDVGNFTLVTSARWDGHDRFDDSVNGRLALGYNLSEWLYRGRNFIASDHQLRASIATGTKNPTLTELFGFFPGSFIGNPDIKPEQSVGVNLGYTGDFEAIEISVDVFRSELRDEIITQFLPGFQSTVANLNTNSTREGVELAFSAEPISNNLALSGQLTLLQSEQDGREEIRRPKTLASLSATWTPHVDWTFNVTANYTGEQIDTDFATVSNVTLDPYTLISGNVRYQFGGPFAVYVRAENLGDETYRDVVGYNSQGRTVFVGLESVF